MTTRLSWILAAGLCLVALGGWYLGAPTGGRAVPTDPSSPPESGSASERLVTVADPAEVFQKAFWKRPAADDTILHAERREWKTEDGVSKWQWFISVRPSPALVRHLIQDNAFMLARSDEGALPPLEEMPEWFPSSKEGLEVFANASKSFRLLWDREKNLLHATDSGGGFRAGAPQPAKPVSVSANTPGRLPLTPPPNPRDELEAK